MRGVYASIFVLAMGYLLLQLAKSFAPTRNFKNSQEPSSTQNHHEAR